jgi:2-polyprenyl-6-methoxyphenol hydroxylase-like FAD-dependent oxidoreductase
MEDKFDVIVVGARCAGSPLATLLTRQGLKVAIVERATFPKDTLSTHIFQAPAINFLRRLGVLDTVLETGARPYNTIQLRQEDFQATFELQPRPGDEGGLMAVRRFVLDPILLEAATDAGAEALMATNVTGLVYDGGRVSGVRVRSNGQDRRLMAKLVVGADGRNSTVGELAGARKYNVLPGERFGYWGYFENADPALEGSLVFHRWDGRFVIAIPTDGGLYLVIVLPALRFLPEFRADREGAYMAHMRACEPVANVLRDARRVGKLLGMVKFETFFRESAGPGWALVGDAGHFKDPAPGQGITDAFRQAEALAPVIARSINDAPESLDAALGDWARWRDRDATEIYWLAADFGAAHRTPELLVESSRMLEREGRVDELGDIFQHRRRPSTVITLPVLAKAARTAMRQPGANRREIIGEFRELIVTDTRRRRLNRKPEYVPITEHRDAGDTEVPEEVAA